MADRPTVIILGADKGGVGKSFCARILLDYLDRQGVNDIKIWDTEFPKGSLNRFYPVAKVIDLEDIKDQMLVIDQMSYESNISVIDVCAGLLSPTLHLFGKIGLMDAVKNNEVNLIILHVLGTSISSLSEIADTAKIISGSKYFLVKNHINDGSYFEWDENITAALSMAPSIDIPQLPELASEKIDQAAVTFSNFVNSKGSFVLRGLTRDWLKQVDAELDRVKIKEVVLRG